MGLESFFEKAGRFLHRGRELEPAKPVVSPWQKRLMRLQEHGASPDEQLLVLMSSLFTPGISEEQQEVVYQKIGATFRTLTRDNTEEMAKAGDPNAIMDLITQSTTEYLGNHDAQVATTAYYLRMGMRPLREKFLMLEAYARTLGIDPYSSDQDTPNNNENS